VKYRLEVTRVTADTHAQMVAPHNLDLTGKTTTLQATAQSLAVSVLDLVATPAGEPAGSAVARSVELARQVEQLGYKRYWVAEHHSIQGLACSAIDEAVPTPVLTASLYERFSSRGEADMATIFSITCKLLSWSLGHNWSQFN
jgi:Luciferase-like monooxygenase